jgi:hypothetical protein
MMVAVNTSETSVHFKKTTQRYIPESCQLYDDDEFNIFGET